MITAEEWWGILGAYNTAIFPMQIITIIVAAILTYFLFTKPGTKTNSFIKAYLAFTFAWIGIVFYLILGKGLTGNYFWASLFIIIAILFVVDIFAKRIEYQKLTRKSIYCFCFGRFLCRCLPKFLVLVFMKI